MAAAVQSGLVWKAWGSGERVQSIVFLSQEPVAMPRLSQTYHFQEGKLPQEKEMSGVVSSSDNAVPSHLQLG